jgi:hypothetical protein
MFLLGPVRLGSLAGFGLGLSALRLFLAPFPVSLSIGEVPQDW